MIVFYSWQSDTPQKTNKRFIHDCLQDAINQICDESQAVLEESDRTDEPITLDHDTKEIPGSPDIVATILKKIESCSVFVADITLTGKNIVSDREKLFPNPNVAVEFGYALRSLGPEKIIRVMDVKHGDPSQLPFDFGGKRWPIMFSSDAADLKVERKKLVGEFKRALRSYYDEHLIQIAPTLLLDWKVVALGGPFEIHFGIRNCSTQSIKDASLRVMQSASLPDVHRLVHINPYATVWYNLSKDSADGTSLRARPHPGRIIAPDETDYALKIAQFWAFDRPFVPMSFEYEIATEHKHIKGKCEISQAAFAERGRVPALGWSP